MQIFFFIKRNYTDLCCTVDNTLIQQINCAGSPEYIVCYELNSVVVSTIECSGPQPILLKI